MNGSVHVICRPEMASGFRLTGVDTTAVDRPADAAHRMHELMAMEGTGVLLVQEDLLSGPAGSIDPRALRPIVVPFPGSQTAPMDAATYIADILRRAVGYRVRLE